MPYLVANSSRSYMLTSTCDKPRLCVGDSYIPIVSGTTGGGCYEL